MSDWGKPEQAPD